MSRKRSYFSAAFNARPFGMPLPPNWFGIAAFALLGAFVNPGLWLIGAGLEGLYLWTLTKNPRFRAVVDADAGDSDWHARYRALNDTLDSSSRELQQGVERQANEIVELLSRTGANESQMKDVRQLAWLHLKLLAARASILQVLAAASREHRNLQDQERRLIDRLSSGAEGDLQRSLERQLEVIRSRRAAHADAERRRELLDAELERLRQQIALVREQALLATDERSAASSLDALSASLNEANRWLKDQRELFAGLDDMTDDAPPPELFRAQASVVRRQKVSE
jgi:hypothetical protein